MDRLVHTADSSVPQADPPLVPIARLPMREPSHPPGANLRISVRRDDSRTVVLAYEPQEFLAEAMIIGIFTVAGAGAVVSITAEWSNAATIGLVAVYLAVVAVLIWWALRRRRTVRGRLEFVIVDPLTGQLHLPQARLTMAFSDALEWQVITVPSRRGRHGMLPHAQLALVHRAGDRSSRQLVLIGMSTHGLMARLGQLLSAQCKCGFQQGDARVFGVDSRGVFVANGWDDPRLAWPIDQPEQDQYADAPDVDCSQCGYSRAGLKAMHVCPECGLGSHETA